MDRLCGGLRPYVLLSLFSLLLFVPGLAELPPMDRDESRFMQATRQMLESGDFIRIQFQDEMRAKKPAGAYWIQAASVRAFSSVSDAEAWAYRLPSMLAALSVVLMVFGFGRTLVGEKPALVAALVTASALMLVSEAHQAKTDALLLACVTLAQGILARFYVSAKAREAQSGGSAGCGSSGSGSSCSSGSCGGSSPNRPMAGGQSPATPRLVEILLFWLAMGVGLLIKGPIVPLVSLMTVLALAVADRNARWFLAMKPVTGTLVACALAAPWFMAVSHATGGAFVGTAVKTDLLPKLLGAQESHGGYPGWYFLLSPGILWPGSLILLPMVGALWQQRGRVVYRVLLAWALPTWILFELIPTKLPHYILPALPALALMAGGLVMEGAEIFRNRWARLWYGLWLLPGLAIAGLVVMAPVKLGTGLSMPTLGLAAGIVLACGLTLALIWRQRMDLAVLSLILVSLATYPGLFQGVVPRLDGLFLSRTVDHIVRTIGSDGPVASAGYSEPSLVFLLGTQTRLLDSGSAAAEHLALHPGALAVVADKEVVAFQQKSRDLGLTVEAFGQADGLNYSRGKTMTLTVFGVVKR